MKRPRSVKDAVLDIAFWLMLGFSMLGAAAFTANQVRDFYKSWK